jgi:hypothetical protein
VLGAAGNGGNGDDSRDDVGDGDEGTMDETGYFEHRDFEVLQKEMLTWLRAVARHVAEHEDDGIQMISMPLGTPIREPQTDILTPLGERPRSFFHANAPSDGAALAEHGVRFFPWWRPELAGAEAGKLAKTLLFTLRWHPPENDDERALIDVALACIDSSPEALRASGIDDLDIAELRRLQRESPQSATAPRPGGFGMLRGPIRWNPFPALSLALPGYFYQDDDHDAKTYWFGDRVVRVTSFVVKGPEGPAPAENLLATAGKNAEGAAEVRSQAASEELPGYTLAFVRDAEQPSLWHAHAGVARPGNLALFTITLADRADFDWAEEVVRSVRFTDDGTDDGGESEQGVPE